MRSSHTTAFDPRATHLGFRFEDIGIDLRARVCDQDCIIEASFFPARGYSPSLLVAITLDKKNNKRTEWREVRDESVVHTWLIPCSQNPEEAFLILKTT